MHEIKDAIDRVRKMLAPELQKIGIDIGMSLKAGHATYNDSNATIKLELAKLSEDGVVESKERVAFKENAHFYGLKPEDLDRRFKANGTTYRLVGLFPSSPKYCIQVLDEGKNKTVKMTLDGVKTGLKHHALS